MSSLFKYFPAMYIKDEAGNERNYALDSIQNNTLWASISDEFNDPFECMVDFESKVIRDYTRSYMERVKKLFGITCFSREDSNLLMWGHYANSHRGICVEYNVDALIKSDEKIKGFKEVHYDTEILKPQDMSPTALVEAAEEVLYRKFKGWSYEQEVRAIVTGVKPVDRGITWSTPTPKSIRLGLKASERLEKDIREIAREKNIELYRMSKVLGKYAIEKQKIEL